MNLDVNAPVFKHAFDFEAYASIFGVQLPAKSAHYKSLSYVLICLWSNRESVTK